MSKLRLAFSPYVYARVSAMKGLLLKADDYDRLLKMGPNEIVRFLLESPQYPEIIDLDKGIQGVEAGLNKHLSMIFAKLHRMADGAMRQVIGKYLLRFDIENVKVIVRSKFAGVAAQDIEPLLYPSVNYAPEFFASLLAKQKPEEVVDALHFIKKKLSGDLFEVENALDRYYVETVLAFAGDLRGQGKIMGGFMRREIDIINIRTILRLRFEGMAKNELDNYLIHPSSVVLKLTDKELPEIVKVLKAKKLTTLVGDEKDLMEKLEIDLNVSLLKKESTLMHSHPLSVNQMLGFMFAKEIEVRNLKVLIKGKQLKVSEEYMEKLLVVPS